MRASRPRRRSFVPHKSPIHPTWRERRRKSKQQRPHTATRSAFTRSRYGTIPAAPTAPTAPRAPIRSPVMRGPRRDRFVRARVASLSSCSPHNDEWSQLIVRLQRPASARGSSSPLGSPGGRSKQGNARPQTASARRCVSSSVDACPRPRPTRPRSAMCMSRCPALRQRGFAQRGFVEQPREDPTAIGRSPGLSPPAPAHSMAGALSTHAPVRSFPPNHPLSPFTVKREHSGIHIFAENPSREPLGIAKFSVSRVGASSDLVISFIAPLAILRTSRASCEVQVKQVCAMLDCLEEMPDGLLLLRTSNIVSGLSESLIQDLVDTRTVSCSSWTGRTGDTDQCSICLRELWTCSNETTMASSSSTDSMEVLRLPCHHDFHTQCVTKWLRQAGWCPLCKAKVVRLADR